LTDLDDEEFVRLAYRVILQREGDDGGVHSWVEFLRAGHWRKDLVEQFVAGEEFRTLGTEPLQARFHRARREWIGSLPLADRVLDIGGSSPACREGALHEMGWSGRPRHLTIVDLPPDDQYHGRPRYSQTEPYRTPWDGEVVYVHARAEDLPASDLLEDTRFDAVFLGQAIEHLEVEAVPPLLRWIHAHLDAGGWLAMDTPNRAVTVLQTGPDALTDPDHQTEYDAPQLERLLLDAGFRIEARAGIVPCARSVAEGRFDPRPTYSGPLVDGDAANGLTMAFVARPGRARWRDRLRPGAGRPLPSGR
jgi:SAM-dependent methyltransferase